MVFKYLENDEGRQQVEQGWLKLCKWVPPSSEQTLPLGARAPCFRWQLLRFYSAGKVLTFSPKWTKEVVFLWPLSSQAAGTDNVTLISSNRAENLITIGTNFPHSAHEFNSNSNRNQGCRHWMKDSPDNSALSLMHEHGPLIHLRGDVPSWFKLFRFGCLTEGRLVFYINTCSVFPLLNLPFVLSDWYYRGPGYRPDPFHSTRGWLQRHNSSISGPFHL